MSASGIESLAPRRVDGGAAYRVPAIVLGLGPTGLGVVRSLASRGVPVIGVYQESRRTPYSYTRLCKKIAVNPSSRNDLWKSLLDLPVGSDRPPLFLTSDVDVLEVSFHRRELRRSFRMLLPPHEELETLMDKTAFARFAAEHGLPTPKTLVVEGGRGWDRVLDECVFPSIIKPKYHTSDWGRAGFSKTFLVHSRDELTSVISTVHGVEDDFVIQEWIPGSDSNVFFHLAYHNGRGKPVASFTGRKIRQWAPLTGSTSMAEPSDNADARVQAQRLFELVRFRGLGSVEFKLDPRDGKLKIMEPTVGRSNLQSALATANGVNIAYRAYCDLVGADPGPASSPTRNVRWVFIERDIRSSLYYIRRQELTLPELFRSYRGPRHYADFSWRDPMPAAMRFAEIVLGWGRRRFRTRKPRRNR